MRYARFKSSPGSAFAATLVSTLLILSPLAGCGGGGSDGSSTTPPPVTTLPVTTSPPTSTPTGLIPAAPTLGATLYADASALRPIAAGSIWSYSGVEVDYAGALPKSYVTTTTQTAATTGVTETSTNTGNDGPDSDNLAYANGTLTQTQAIDFAGLGSADTINFIELRSPVVQGDQYTSFDHHYATSSIDADGDKKPDPLDVAIYARVIGIESVALPSLGTVSAVRVDTVVLTRVQYSSTGQYSPVLQATIQTWYAPGLGIVRQLTTVPASNGSGNQTTDELLVSHSG